MKTAVILAAGMGTRLQHVIGQIPKGLLEIDDTTLLARSITLLLSYGVKRIVIVVGYKSSLIIESLSSFSSKIEFVINDQYTDTGSMHSMFMTKEIIDNDILLLESDLIYENRALEVLNNKANDLILISGVTHSGDEVYVYGDGDYITAISKNKLSKHRIKGELVGISKISYSLYKNMMDYYENNISDLSSCHYEECLSSLSHKHLIQFVKIDDLAWTEIDDNYHLERALTLVYPRILANDREYGKNF